MRDMTLRADLDIAAEHVASTERVPLDILPPGPACDTLLRLATEGRDCYAYASGGGELTGTWCARLSDLADVREERDGRVPLAKEWVPNFRALLAEMGVPARDEGVRR
jgi:hypothetical protein